MSRMSCAACHYTQLIAFPSITVEGQPAAQYESRALEIESFPGSLNKRVTIYACPNCGALRIKVKLLN